MRMTAEQSAVARSRYRYTSCCCAGLCVLLVAGTQMVRAHHVEGLSVDTLTRRAAVIVEGKITRVASAWNVNQTQIQTTVTLKVEKYHKGDLKQNTIDITFLGGVVGNITMAVIGQPSFAMNEDVFLFLRPNDTVRDVPFVGAHEGKFTVTTDPVTQVKRLRNVHMTVTKASTIETIERIMQPVLAAAAERGEE